MFIFQLNWNIKLKLNKKLCQLYSLAPPGDVNIAFVVVAADV